MKSLSDWINFSNSKSNLISPLIKKIHFYVQVVAWHWLDLEELYQNFMTKIWNILCCCQVLMSHVNMCCLQRQSLFECQNTHPGILSFNGSIFKVCQAEFGLKEKILLKFDDYIKVHSCLTFKLWQHNNKSWNINVCVKLLYHWVAKAINSDSVNMKGTNVEAIIIVKGGLRFYQTCYSKPWKLNVLWGCRIGQVIG